MTPKQRRVQLVVWLLIGPLLIVALLIAAANFSSPSPARDWPAEVTP